MSNDEVQHTEWCLWCQGTGVFTGTGGPFACVPCHGKGFHIVGEPRIWAGSYDTDPAWGDTH